ncbi:IclR family transcriptional regulator [Micrococcus lylae]|uniref:IclR family transcriptional regulator n=1 Tax=Micrococcus lylae TaxID=1273 RepID=A0ABY2K2T2_9MICC|nr:IclR family transcriptional regulator [Micrococcus lylae]TFH98700.1 IclR family transcriptional regulator [Micrococcus lylae]
MKNVESVRQSESTTGRVVRVLLAFSEGKTELGVSEIGRMSGLSKAVAHRILQELCAAHVVEQDRQTRKYRLGSAALALGDAAAASSRLRAEGLPTLAELAEVTGETATLSARVGYRRLYVGQVESSRLIRISVQVGLSLPLTVGASGQAMLAFLPEREIEWVLNRPVPAMSDRTETRPERIRGRLEHVREVGYARTDSERVAEAVSFAAPVFNSYKEVVGAVSVAALASRVEPDREAELGDDVVAASRELSRRL